MLPRFTYLLIRALWFLLSSYGFLFVHAVSSAIPISLERGMDDRLRLRFEGAIGQTYLLEASNALEGDWETYSIIEVDEAEEVLTLRLGEEALPTFWRIVHESYADTLEVSPVVALFELTEVTPNAAFQVVARSPVEVTEVRFLSDGLLRGLAEREEGGATWVYRESADIAHPESVELSAVAENEEGDTAASPVARFLLADPRRLVPLDASGKPLGGRFVSLDEAGDLAPFEFRPDGAAPLLKQSGVRVVFGEGGRMVLEDGRYWIEATSAAVFLGSHDSVADSLQSESPFRIPLDGLAAGDLAELLYGDESEPVPLSLLPERVFNWESGPLDAHGIDSADTSPEYEDLANIPLSGRPDESEITEDETTGEPIYKAIYYGSYTLFGGVGARIPRQAPWTFVFRQNGEVELSGETEITLPNGAKFNGSVSLREGRICFSLSAKKLTADTLGSLLELLPENPADCVPASADDEAMNLALACLDAYAKSYRAFAAGAVQIDAVDFERDLVPLSTPYDTSAAALEAWAWRLTALGVDALPATLADEAIDRLADLTGHAAESGRAAFDLPGLLAWQRALTRFREALEAARAAGKIGDVAALESELESATRVVLQALDRKIRETEPAELVPLLGDTVKLLLEIAEIQEAFALEDESEAFEGPGFRELSGRVVTTVGLLYFTEMGVVADEFDPVFNDTLLTLDRFSTAQALRQTLDLWALVQILDLSEADGVLPIEEALQQFVTHLADIHEADVRDALERNSYELAFIVMRQRLDLMAEISLLGLDDAFPDFFDPAALLEHWDPIVEQLINNPSQAWRRNSLLEALRYVTKTLAYVPQRAGAYSQSLRADLIGLLDDFFETGRFNTELGPRDWMEWLEGGVLGDRLGRRHFASNFVQPYSETNTKTRLEILVEGLVDASGGGEGGESSENDLQHAFLDAAANLISSEIRLLGIEAQDTSLDAGVRAERRATRLAYLEALGRLLNGYQSVATRLYAEARQRPGSVAFLNDMLLPGAIKAHEVSGAACFTPATGAFSGRFSGDLQLPKFDTRLVIANASFDSRGNFQLAAHGQAAFPGSPTPEADRVILQVPSRRPLAIAIHDDGAFSVSGGASLTIPGGHTFKGYLSIDDPEYVFELAYGGGLRIDLLDKVTLARPTLELDPQTPLDLGASEALARFLGGLAMGYESFVEDAPDFPSPTDLDPGAAPEFQNPTVTVPTDAFDAWLTSLVNEEVVDRLNGSYNDAAGSLAGLLQSIDEEIEAARQEVAPDLSQLQRLKRRQELIEEAEVALGTASERQLLDTGNAAALLESVRDRADQIAELSSVYVSSLPEDAELRFVLAALELHVESVGTAQAAGGDATYDPALLAPVLRNSGDQLLEEIGLNADGSVGDLGKLEATSDRRLLVVARTLFQLEALEVEAGLEETPVADPVDYVGVGRQLIGIARDRKFAAFNEAVARQNLEDQVLNAIWLVEFNAMAAQGVVDPSPEIPVNYDAFGETLDLIRARRGGASSTDEKLALDFAQAAYDNVAVEWDIIEKESRQQLGQTKRTRVFLKPHPQRGQRWGSYSYWDLLARNWELLEGEGLLNPVALAALKGNLALALGEYRSTLLGDNQVDVTFVEQNLSTVYDGLLAATDVIAWIEEYLPEETQLLTEWKASWEELTVEFYGVAESRRAWWRLTEFSTNLVAASTRYGEGVGEATQALFATAGASALASLETVVDAMGEVFASVDLDTFDFPLPGDLTVERMYGRLAFNRLSLDWQVGFGGAVRFPEVNLFFALDRAALDSAGNFDLKLRTSGPVPFGFDDELSLNVANAFSLTGNLLAPSIASASASGLLLRDPGGGAAVESYNVSLSYAYDEPRQHVFEFSAAFSGDREFFTEDLVIFQGGFGFTLALNENGAPTQTEFTASSTVGMIAKSKPLAANPSPNDFELLFEGTASIAVIAQQTQITLGPGIVKLPESFEGRSCGSPGIPIPGANRPSASVSAEAPFVFTYTPDGGSGPSDPLAGEVAFSGSVAFENLRFSLRGIEGLWIDVCQLTLEFGFDSQTSLPSATLANLEGQVNVPLPGEQNLRTGLEVDDWSLDRLPQSGTFYLAEDLALLEQGGFTLTARGGRDSLDMPRSGISVFTDEATGLAGFALSGAFAAKAADWFQNRSGENVAVEGEVAGSLTVMPPPNLEDLSLDHFVFDIPLIEIGAEGELLFGGESGLAIVDPKLTVTNPLFALYPTTDTPFKIGLDMGVRIVSGAAYDFTVEAEQMELIFNGADDAPLVALGALGGCLEAADLNGGEPVSMAEDLPFYVRRFCFGLKNLTESGPVPLFPSNAEALPAFSLQNVEMLISAGLSLPPGAPIVTGEVSDLTVAFADNNVPTLSLDGIGLGVDLTEYLGEEFPFGGTVFIGGFQTGKYYFAGTVQANIKGNLVDGIVAFDTEGLRGLCFGLSGSEVNVPIAYGFVLTGARGGLALGDGSVDPCDFVSLMNIDPDTGMPSPVGPGTPPDELEDPFGDCPLLKWEELQALKDGALDREQIALDMAKVETVERLVSEDGLTGAEAAEAVEGATADELEQINADIDDRNLDSYCPTPGNCPPASLGLLAQPHPEYFEEGSLYEGRAILKFTSIDEATLNSWGIDRDLIDSLVPVGAFDRDAIAARFGEELRWRVDALIPRPPSDLPAPLPDWAANFDDQLEMLLNDIEVGFFNSVACGLDVLGAPADRDALVDGIYQIVTDAAYAGIPYTDLSFRLEGSFSYTGVASFASVTGGALISTSGTAGVIGSINVFGLPVGKARVFVTQTDAYGNPSAGLCGEIDVEVGPLDLGTAGALYDNPGYEARLLSAFMNLGSALTGPYVFEIMREILPQEADPDLTPNEHFALLDTNELRYAFLATMANNPPTLQTGVPTAVFRQFMVELADAFGPRLAACGTISPKIFGIPLSGGNDLLGGQFYMGPIDTQNIPEGFLFSMNYRFSPAQVFSSFLFTTWSAFFVPAIDQAEAATYFEVDSLGTLLNEGFVLSPDKFLNNRVSDFMDTAITTYSYELSPFGVTLGKAAGRVIMPSFEHHPRGDDPLTPPSERKGLPSELDVLFAALGGPGEENLLADPLWRGDAGDLHELFEGTPFQSAIEREKPDLVDSYFPHGGFLGAAELNIPKLISEGLPNSYLTLVDPAKPPLERLTAFQEFLAYIGESDVAGQFSFYVPAPNPPSLLASGFPKTAEAFFDDFRNYDAIRDFSRLYPVEEAFVRGTLDTTLLGLPVANADLLLVPEEQLYRATANVPSDSWMARLLGESTFVAQIRQGANAQKPIGQWLGEWRQKAEQEVDVTDRAAVHDFLNETLSDLNRRLPRINVNIENSGFRVPFPGYNPSVPLTPEAAALNFDSVAFAAYSPQFDPDHPGNSPFDRIRREGGVGFEGGFSFDSGGVELAGANASVVVRNDISAFGLPSFSGEFTAQSLSVAGLGFPSTNGIRGTLEASATQISLGLEGQSDLIPFASFNLAPLPGESVFPYRVDLSTDATTFSAAASLSVGPARVQVPFLSEESLAVIHGDSIKDPFTFYSENDWSASGTLQDPAFDLVVGSVVVARLSGSDVEEIALSLEGDGLSIEEFELLSLPAGMVVETYPNLGTGDVRKHTLTIGPDVTGSLRVSRGGEFRLELESDLGVSVGELNGASLSPGFELVLTESSFSLDAALATLPLLGFGELRARDDDTDGLLALEASASLGGDVAFELEAAELAFTLPLIESTALIDGGGVDSKSNPLPIAFKSDGDWSARIVFESLLLDPDGSGKGAGGPIPTFVEMVPRTSKFGETDSLFIATLEGDGLDSVSFTASRSAAYRLEFLPGTAFSKTFDNFSAGEQQFTLDSSGQFRLAVENFNPGTFDLATIPVGVSEVTLLSVSGSGSSDFEVNNTGMTVQFAAPSIQLVGESLSSGDLGTFTASMGTSGAFSATFESEDNVNLFGSLLQLRAGTQELSGTIGDLASTLQVEARGRIQIEAPTLTGSTVGSQTLSHNFDLLFDAGAPFSYEWNPFPNTIGFDLGWARVEAGGAGRVKLARDGSDFSIEVENWDVFLFGESFNNQLDIAFSTSGAGSVSLGSATFDFDPEEDHWIQIATNANIPFSWNAATGAVSMEFPTQADLFLPGIDFDSGTFVTGLDIPSNFPALGTDGTFDHTFQRTINLNGANFGSIDVRFYRSFANGNVRFLIDHEIGGDFGGLELDLYVSTGNVQRARIVGELEVPINGFFGTWATLDGSDADGKLELLSVDLDLKKDDGAQFDGSATILGIGYDVVIGTGEAYVSPNFVGWLQFPLPTL